MKAKKIVSLLLVLCLLVSCVPFSANAGAVINLRDIIPDQSFRYEVISQIKYPYPYAENVMVTAEELAAVKKLDLDSYWNVVKDLTGLEYFPNLQYLNISTLYCEVPSVVWNMTDLTYLGLGSVGLTELPAEIGNLTKLVTLDLGYTSYRGPENNIQTLPEEIGNLTELEKIILNNNSLSALPDSFVNLKKLRYFDASNNLFSEFPEELTELTELETLILYNPYWRDNEGIRFLPSSFSNLTKLKSLHLDGHQLAEFPDALRDLNLTYFSLVSNPVTNEIPQWAIDKYPYALIGFKGDLQPQSTVRGGTLNYNLFIPDVIRQVIALNGSVVEGTWEITRPDGEVTMILALDGSEMSHYVFDQEGEYAVTYYALNNVGEELESISYPFAVGSKYTTRVTVTNAAVSPDPFPIDIMVAGSARSNTGEYTLSISGFIEALVMEGSNKLSMEQIFEQFITISARNLHNGERRVLDQNTVEYLEIIVENGEATEIVLKGRVQTTTGAFDRYTTTIYL